MRLEQRVFDACLDQRGNNAPARLRRMAAHRIRKALLSRDPLVRYTLDGFDMELPLSHHLPFIRRAQPEYSKPIGRIAGYLKRKYPDLTVVDIGANIGDTAIIIRANTTSRILCIEGDAGFVAILERNVRRLEGVVVEESFVDTSTRSENVEVRGRGGTAHIVYGTGGDEVVGLKSLSDILAEHPGFAASKLIKIDTDGYDVRIMMSESDLLTRLRPVVFFEYDPYSQELVGEDGFPIFEYLRRLGYACLLIFDSSGEYMVRTSTADQGVIEDLHHFYSNRGGLKYCDICAIHRVDSDLCDAIRQDEISYFATRRQRLAERFGER